MEKTSKNFAVLKITFYWFCMDSSDDLNLNFTCKPYFLFPKVNEDRHYMKRKEANAFEEQLLKQKMDELHKKLHQVVETSHENLPSSQGRSEVCVLLADASHAQYRDFCFYLSSVCSIFRVNSDVNLVTSFLNYFPPNNGGKGNPTRFQRRRGHT